MADQFRILLVDDDSLMLKLFGAKLAEAGFNLAYAHDGYEAREMVKRAKPNLIILDIMMPKMNGLELLGAIREDPDTKDVPAVFLTNLDDRPEDVQAAKQLGSLGIINKSIDLSEFVKEIKNITSSLQAQQ